MKNSLLKKPFIRIRCFTIILLLITVTATAQISVLNKNGAIISDPLLSVNKNGAVGLGTGVTPFGEFLSTSELVPGMFLHLDASNTSSYSGSGTTWNDVSGNSNHGTLQNGVTYNSANRGSLVFDGTDDYFVTDNTLDLSDTDKLTIQVILKTGSIETDIILEHSTDWNSNNAFGVTANNGKMRVTDQKEGYNVANAPETIADANWHLITATTNRSLGETNQSQIYIDGNAASAENNPDLIHDIMGNYASFPLFIGSRGGSEYFFTGNIAQVILYKRVLTVEEIQQNFNALKIKYTLPLLSTPTVSTVAISGITTSAATSGGAVSSNGGSTITARGLVWSASSNPTLSDNVLANGSGIGTFTNSLSNLTANTTYYVRAYATNATGTGYGNVVQFTTSAPPPVVPLVVTSSTVTITTGGNIEFTGGITDDRGSVITAQGFVWGTLLNPTISDNFASVPITCPPSGCNNFYPSFSKQLSPLFFTTGVTYYVRAYATNANGTGYGGTIQIVKESSGTIRDTVLF